MADLDNLYTEELRYDIRIKCVDIDGNILDGFENKKFPNLSNVIIAITPYVIKTNIINYDDSDFNKQTIIRSMSDLENSLLPTYSTDDFKFISSENKSLEDCFSIIRDLFDYQSFKNSVNLELFINPSYTKPITIDKIFVTFLFKIFNNNIILNLTDQTFIYIPNGKIQLNSLIINRGNIKLKKITHFTLDSVSFNNISLSSDGSKLPEQLGFDIKSSSNFSFLQIQSSIRIGITGLVESHYKWMNTKLTIDNVFINFDTNTDRDKKFDSIFKITNIFDVNIYNIFIVKSLTKLILFKFIDIPTLNVYHIEDILKPPKKGVPSFSLENVTDFNFIDINIQTIQNNSDDTAIFSFVSSENFGNGLFKDINISNNSFLSVSGYNINEITILDSNFVSEMDLFDIDTSDDLYFGNISLINCNIDVSSVGLTNIENYLIQNCYIESSSITLEGFKIIINETEFVSTEDIIINNKGYDYRDEETEKEPQAGSIKITDSTFDTTKAFKFESIRLNDTLKFNNTNLKCNNYSDKNFRNVTFNQSQLVSTYGNLDSLDYKFNNSILNNEKIISSEDSFIITGYVSGKLNIIYQDSNSNLGLTFKQETLNNSEKDKLELILQGNDNLILKSKIKILNYHLSLLVSTITKNSSANIDFVLEDNTPELYYYTTGNYIFKDKSASNINFTYSNLSVDKKEYVLENDGTKEIDLNKLNLGIKP